MSTEEITTHRMPAPGTPTDNPRPAATANPGIGLGIASLVLGICSIAYGHFLILPVIGLVLAHMSRKREPDAHRLAFWGSLLNGVCLAIPLIFMALAAIFVLPNLNW